MSFREFFFQFSILTPPFLYYNRKNRLWRGSLTDCGGFAAYGIYPEYRDFYAFHIFFEDNTTRRECETLLKEGFEIVQAEVIPIRIIPEITDVPLIWRYFVSPLNSVLSRLQLDEKEFVARTVMEINTKLKGAYVFSSGKNMGTFKAVG